MCKMIRHKHGKGSFSMIRFSLRYLLISLLIIQEEDWTVLVENSNSKSPRPKYRRGCKERKGIEGGLTSDSIFTLTE